MIHRAKPLLGTIVAIGAEAAPAAVDAAFAAIERVHEIMSAQRSESDIGRVNREAHRRSVAIDPLTSQVMKLALRVSERTRGAFDIVMPGSGARHTDIVLEDDAIRLRRPAKLDVSGIAKGFAVDLAVARLEEHGARAGCVNAGGDLRFFGRRAQAVRVRHPGDPLRAISLPDCAYPAYATSSGYFGATLSDPRSASIGTLDWSITVAAASCAIADALTKAVALLGPLPQLLRAFDATAFAVDREGRLHAPAG